MLKPQNIVYHLSRSVLKPRISAQYHVHLFTTENFNPIQVAHGWGEGVKMPPSLNSVTHIITCNYTLPKEGPKKCKSRDTPLEFYWDQHF